MSEIDKILLLPAAWQLDDYLEAKSRLKQLWLNAVGDMETEPLKGTNANQRRNGRNQLRAKLNTVIEELFQPTPTSKAKK